jgi:hypothetical protein
MLMRLSGREPFPVVLPESLLCSTPSSRSAGAACPKAHDGRTGFICDTLDEMCVAVGRLAEINRGVPRGSGTTLRPADHGSVRDAVSTSHRRGGVQRRVSAQRFQD